MVCCGLICPRGQTPTEWFMRMPRDACPGAQTCCALKSSAPAGAHQDNCADLLGLQTRRGSNQSAAHVGESNSRSNDFQIRRTSVCVSSRCWHSLLLEMGNQCRKTTLVAHFRGSTMQFCAKPQDLRKSTRVYRVVIGWRTRWRIKFTLERFSDPSDICLRIHPLKNSAGRVPQAADDTCNKISQTGSCRSPRTV
jgi:hypothetical protein